MLKSIKSLAILVSLAVTTIAVPSLAETSYTAKPNKGAGQLIGGLIGYKLADEMSKDKSKGQQNFAKILGALVGASIGGKAASGVDKKDAMILESDNPIMDNTGIAALRTGQVQYWQNPRTGSHGVIEPTVAYYKVVNGYQLPCRQLYTQSVRNNIPHKGQMEACMYNDGVWRKQ